MRLTVAAVRDFIRSHALMLVAFVLLVLANGRWIVPLGGWVAPVLWIRMLERSPSRRQSSTVFIVFAAAFVVAWWGLVPAPPAAYLAIVVTYAAVFFVPFLLHRSLAPRLPALASTLVFPTAWVALEILFQRFGTPYGSWFSLAYSQASNLPLLQVASVAGTAGVTFIICWAASVAAYAWKCDWKWSEARSPVIAATALIATVLVAGQWRISSAPRDGDRIRVAALVPDPDLSREVRRAIRKFLGQRDAAAEAELGVAVERLNNDLLDRTRRAAAAGAKVVAWSEGAARLFASDEAELIRRIRAVAVEERIDLFAGYGVYTPGREKPLGNRMTSVRSDGTVEWTFDKANPIWLAESKMLAPGDGRMQVARTAAGAATVAICHDFDFPPLIRQASSNGATLLIAPSDDWPAITSMHANMAIVRAIENGIPLVRPTSGGRTLFANEVGVTIAHEDAARDFVIASVTARHRPTIYGRFGDLFAWSAVAALAVLFVVARRRASAERRLQIYFPEAGSTGALLFSLVLLLPSSASAAGAALTKADAALDACIAAAKSGNEKVALETAAVAERLYTDAEKEDAPAADVATGRARILSQCRVRFAGVLQQPSMVKQSNALLRRALASDPNHLIARFTLAMNHYFTPKMFGQTENALREFELIATRWGERRDLPLIADVYLYLGRTYERLGRDEEARRAWLKGATLFPDDARLRKRAQS